MSHELPVKLSIFIIFIFFLVCSSQMRQSMTRGGRSSAERVLMGAIIMTRYNNKTYKIDDIAWEESASGHFSGRDGRRVTYAEYYQNKYGLRIKDPKQPLLVSRLKDYQRRNPQGEAEVTRFREL